MGEQEKPTEEVKYLFADRIYDTAINEYGMERYRVAHYRDVEAALASARAEVEALRERERVLTEALVDANEWIRVVSDAADHVTWEQRGPGTIVHIITEPTTRPLFARAALTPEPKT